MKMVPIPNHSQIHKDSPSCAGCTPLLLTPLLGGMLGLSTQDAVGYKESHPKKCLLYHLYPPV